MVGSERINPELSSDSPAAHMVILMRPLFRMGHFFGVFPLEYDTSNPDRALYVKKWCFNYWKCILVLGLSSLYLIFHIVSISISIWRKDNLIEIIGQSLWFQASIVSYLISIRLLLQPQLFIKLYTKDWKIVEAECGKVFSSTSVQTFAKYCWLLYLTLGLSSTILVGIHSIQVPTYPAYILHYIYGDGRNIFKNMSSESLIIDIKEEDKNHPPMVVLIIHTIIQSWFMVWKWTGSAMVDVSLSLYGYVVAQTMEATLNQVIEQMEHFQTIALDEHVTHIDHDNLGLCAAIEANDGILPPLINEETPKSIGNNQNQFIAEMDMARLNIRNSDGLTPSVKMMRLLDKYQKLAQLVTDVNRAIGPVLLIDFAQLILMICALVFLPIKYSEQFQWSSTLLFSGNAIVFIIRLILLTICLGDVYPAAIEVNMRIAKFLISNSSKLDSNLFNPILGHLSVFSANPISFNAWGFFPITRGTLLATLSVISTYIVVLLQVK